MRLKHFVSVLLMLFAMSIGNVWGETVTYTVSSVSAVTTTGTAPDGSSAALSGTGTLNSGFIQCSNGKSHNLTLTGYAGYKITAITINVKSNSSKGTGSFSVVAGSTTIASIAESAFNLADWNGAWSTSGVNKELTMTDAAYEIQEDENVVFTINCKSGSSNYNSLYISSWAITYEAVGGGGDVIVKTLKSIAVSGQTTTYDQNASFSFDGTCTATYSVTKNDEPQDDEEKEVTPTSVSSPDMTTTGEKEVTVSFTDGGVTKTAKYTITVNEHVVTPGEYTITFNNAFFGTTGLNGSLSGTNLKDYSGTQNDITIDYKKGSGSNMYLKDSEIRLYVGNSLVVNAPAGYVITKVDKLVSGINADKGEIDASYIWTGKESAVTFSKTGSGGLALSSFKVTYAAIAPEVTVDPASLSFTAKQNIAVDGKKFTLTGANLTSGLTLAASTGFSVSPTSLTAEAAMAQGGAEVTVTPATPTATTTPVEGTVTISGGGLSESVEVALSMAVTPTYLVGIAVNSNTMGSATINSGTASIYVTDDEEIALVATPAEHHEFVNWTVSDANIVLNNKNAATTTALAAAAGTITANFQEQACSELDAPTLDEITKDYQSATIAWNAVTNAEGYVLNITKHEDGSAVLTNELIVAPEVSFEKTSLEANTQYDYTVMAIGDGQTYCDANNPVLNSNFTTSDYPAATLSLVENGGTPYNWGSNLKLNSVIALPDELDGLGCTGKVLAGWDADENCATTPTYAKGADYTIASTADVLYAVFANEQVSEVTEHSVFATTSLGSDNTVTSGFAVSAQAESKPGYYQDGSGTTRYVQVKVSNAETQIIPEEPTTITIKAKIGGGTAKDPLTNNVYAVLIDADQNAIGDPVLLTTKVTAATGSDFEASMPIANYANVRGARVTHEKETSYNVRYYAISLSYTTGGGVSYSGYTTECTAQLPTLDAPTFSLEAGSYYDALQTVTLTATNSADIYYTLDGTEPTTESTKYTGAIALNARGEYTIKAIAAKEGFETSEVLARTYNIVLPYDFADFAALEKEDGKEYAVRGIISEKGTLTSGSQLPYYISANGQTTGQIKCHNGLKLNKETFTSADDVNLGDNVTVVGTWSTQYSNLNAGNWMLEYTARAHDSYAIDGELTASSFDNGDAFDAAILNNLTVKETFTNDYYETVASGVTFNVGEKTAWAEGDTKLTVNAVLNEETIATKDFDVTVSSALLESIALKADDENYQTKVVYYLGETFVAPTIVATLDDASSYGAAATLVSGFDNENAENVGVQEVTVSYTRGGVTKEVSYNITMKAIFNNEDAPHTVAEANALINAHGETSASSDYMWVRGIVSGFKGTSNNQYYISDDGTATDQLFVYNGKYFNDATMNATNKPAVGDVVILKTKMQIYSNAPELSSSVVVYQLREGALSIEDVTGFEVGSADLNVTVTTASNGDITFTSGDETVVSIVDGNLHAVAAGTATITANLAATENEGAINYTAATTTFSVTVIATLPRYTVTFDANGGTGTDPVIADQLEGAPVELPANPYSKENSAFAGWLCDVDGQTYEEGAEYTMTAANVTFTAQWNIVATCAISFQIGGQEVATANAPQTVEYPFTQVGATIPGFTWVGWSKMEVSDEAEEMPTIITSYTPEAGESSLTLYGIYSRVDDSDPNYGKYVKATAVAEGDYLIVCENQNVAFDGSLETLDATGNTREVAITDGALTLANAENYVFTIAEVTGGYSIKAANGKYIGHGSDANGLTASGNVLVNTITITDGNADIVGSGSAHLRYNKASNQTRFRYFKTTSYEGQEAIQLYKKNVGYTVYTSSPVEKVTVTFAWAGGDGGCQTTKINKGSELTICDAVPTKEHSEFAGWKNGDDVYEAGQAYTFEEDITITAQWNEAAKYTVTYVKGSDETGEAPTDNNEYFAGDQVTVLAQGNLEKEGYEFQGWLNGNKLYAAAATFAMPAENVTLTAQWRKENVAEVASEKMTLITDASGLINGMEVALGCSYGENNFAMAGEISSDVMASVTEGVSLSDGIATFTSSVVMMIAEQVEGGWTLRKDETNYLKENTAKKVAWATSEDATVWTISFNNGNVVIANGSNKLQFNSGSPRFTTYSSAQTAIQLFGKAIVVTDDVNISDLGYVGEDQPIVASGQNVTLTIDEPTTTPSITATNGATVVIDAPTTAQSVNVEEGSKIEVNEPTTTPIVTFATTLGSTDAPSTGAALGTANNITLAAGGEIHYDITLAASLNGQQADPNQWHAFTVPFPVSVSNGIYNAETGAKLTNEVDYAIMSYHGDLRAEGKYGWKKYRGTLVPGTFYIMTVNGDVKTFRFKMSVAENTVLQALNSMAYTAFGGTDANPNYGWNGIGNPSWVSVTVGFPVQVLDPFSYEYQTLTAGTVISASTPFFYKANATSTMTMTESDANAQYAPARTPADEIKNMAVSFGNEVFADKLYVTASEDALNSYEQDKDLVKMTMSNTPKVAQIFGDAYGMKLSMVNTPLVNDKAEVALTLYAPQAGEYTIAAPKMSNAEVYLMREGTVIWNLSTSDYTADFDKGNNAGYSIMIQARAPQIITDLENINALDGENGVQKLLIDGQIYILRNEKMYDVNGKMVK